MAKNKSDQAETTVPKGNFSRRHVTSQRHTEAVAAYLKGRRSDAVIAAEVRQEERNVRTPAQQTTLLDERLGEGVGATKERARLAAMASNKAAGKREKIAA